LQDGSVTSQRITNASVIQTFTFGSPIVAPTPDANDDVYQVSPAGTAEHCRSTCISVARTALLFSLTHHHLAAFLLSHAFCPADERVLPPDVDALCADLAARQLYQL
jgi:hypothetical protein